MSSGDGSHQRSLQRAQDHHQLTDLIEGLNRRLRSVRGSDMWSEIELTIPQFRALDLLISGPRRMSDIAQELGISLPSATSLIDRLTDKRLAERQHDTADRRVVICQITAAGRVEVERLCRVGQARMDVLVEVLTDDELAQVTDAFTTLADAALRLSPDGAGLLAHADRPIRVPPEVAAQDGGSDRIVRGGDPQAAATEWKRG